MSILSDSASIAEAHASIYAEGKLLNEQTIPLPIIIGRQNPEAQEPLPFQIVPSLGNQPAKFVVEQFHRQSSLSRNHVLLASGKNDFLEITNVGKNPVSITSNGVVLQGGEKTELPLPLDLAVGAFIVSLKQPVEEESFSSLGFQTKNPGTKSRVLLKGKLASLLEKVDTELRSELFECLRDVLVVLQEAASEADFFCTAANALRNVVGLQNAAVMVYEQGAWRPQVVVGDGRDDEWRPSRGALAQLLKNRTTLRSKGAAESQSIMNVSFLVAAPILDENGNVVGALYGDRREVTRPSGPVEVSEVEAMLADMLASAVGSGIIRLRQEQQAVANKVRLEQFFTPVLARELETNDQLMRCKQSNVTCLFCDVRGFSGVSERCGPTVTLDWLSDVMERLGQCVLDTGGVLVDQIGDEFLAMWGAPQECDDHASRSLAALRQMLTITPQLDRDWQKRIGVPTQVGFGLHSGVAVVGNTGSKLRFRYAPLGDTVNLASRLQGCTKYFKVPAILSEATAQACAETQRRRLGRIKVVNRDQDTNVYEFCSKPDTAFAEIKQRYEEALAIFEQGDFRQTIQKLGGLLAMHPDDGPTLLLLSRSYAALTQGRDPFHPVWTLPGK